MRVVRKNINIHTSPPYKILKVAAYCRISILHENQLCSLENQTSYYENEIRKNRNWKFAYVYADKASGRDITKRKEFQKMILDCKNGKIDLILTKSLSRFGRNTLDTLKVLKELKELGVDVYFENEKIHLLQQKSELMLTIYAALYQNESEEKSYNIRWGIKRSFESIDTKYQKRICYGYCHDNDGKLRIEPAEASVVREIFEIYITGASLRQIAFELNSREIVSPTGFKTWSCETINKILSNEKYTGNVLLQKTVVKDFFSEKQIINTNEAKYLITGCNPVIITEEKFTQVQTEKMRRKSDKSKNY